MISLHPAPIVLDGSWMEGVNAPFIQNNQLVYPVHQFSIAPGTQVLVQRHPLTIEWARAQGLEPYCLRKYKFEWATRIIYATANDIERAPKLSPKLSPLPPLGHVGVFHLTPENTQLLCGAQEFLLISGGIFPPTPLGIVSNGDGALLTTIPSLPHAIVHPDPASIAEAKKYFFKVFVISGQAQNGVITVQECI